MFRRFGVAPVILTVFAAQAAVRDAAVSQVVIVKVFDYAGAGSHALAGMSDEAERLFRLAGVATVWIACPGPEVCSRPIRPGEFILRIVAEAPRAALGYAEVMPEGGAYATVVFGRVA